MATRVLAALAALAALSLAPEARADEFRTWTDAKGRFSVEAKILTVADGKVTLLRKDNREVTVGLDRLSDEDRRYAATWQKEHDNPFKPLEVEDAENGSPSTGNATTADAATGVPSDGGSPAADPDAEAMKEVKVVVSEWRNARTLPLAEAKYRWRLPAAATSPGSTAGRRDAPPASFVLPDSGKYAQKVNGLVVTPAGRLAAVGFEAGRWRSSDDDVPMPPSQRDSGGRSRFHSHSSLRDERSLVVLCDLQEGKVLGQTSIPYPMRPLALSDDGEQLLLASTVMHETGWLELWQNTPAGFKKQMEWLPYGQHFFFGTVHGAAFLPDGRVLTYGGDSVVALWTLGMPRPVYCAKLTGSCRPALNADRTWLALAGESMLAVVDAATGRVLAMDRLPPDAALSGLAFNSDGSRLAGAGRQGLYIWDTAKGKLDDRIAVGGLDGRERIAYAGNKYLLIGSPSFSLCDLECQAVAWRYEDCAAGVLVGNVFWYVAREMTEDRYTLAPLPVPRPEVLDAVAGIRSGPLFHAFRPGEGVRLNLDAVPEGDARDEALKLLTGMLKEKDLAVADDGEVELTVGIETLAERELPYRADGASPSTPVQKLKYQPRAYRLEFFYQGKSVWQYQPANPPLPSLQLRKGETVEQALQRYEQPRVADLAAAIMPRVFTGIAPGEEHFGRSQLSSTGPVVIKPLATKGS